MKINELVHRLLEFPFDAEVWFNFYSANDCYPIYDLDRGDIELLGAIGNVQKESVCVHLGRE